MAEGVSIMTGLTYNGTDKDGRELWDSCANIRIRNYERASSCHDLVLSFNINPNRWMAKYVFKRLRFLGSKELSQGITLFFLALWHGLYSGYFVNFALEFFVILFEKQAGPLLSSLWLVRQLQRVYIGQLMVWTVKKLYTQFVLGYALVSFCLFTFERYSSVYTSVYWVGHLGFMVVWPLFFLLVSSLRHKDISRSMKEKERLE
jgi:lysophospholipid acyltransferase 5